MNYLGANYMLWLRNAMCLPIRYNLDIQDANYKKYDILQILSEINNMTAPHLILSNVLINMQWISL